MNNNVSNAIAGLKKRQQALTITIGNQKGGVGKTTNTTLIGYTLANMGLKVLVADLDPQSNATKSLMLTKSTNNPDEVATINKTIMRGVQDRDLTDLPIKIISNLYLLPSFIDFEDFAKHLYKNTNSEREEDFFLDPLFKPLKNNFDLILIDVPPLTPEVTKNAVTMSDYVLISLQTQERSLTGAENYIKTLSKLKAKYNLPIDIIGILQVLHQNRGTVDQFIMNNAKDEFGKDSIFKTVVPQMERIKRFDINGIRNKDQFDKKVLSLYRTVTEELLTRIDYFGY
ncbi:ParA family protein [Lactiplantibacillus plantarum]|uniref:ParA family protein n=1 Tax=Lactiplantibacillus TaxID=2767842 RepID=UPI001F16260D|nr:ParA family protein [Lactiplantibacillus plantarum]MCG0724142.1 Replication protein(RepB) [Lactiplantibacillus plantarum]UJL26261.1 ParA family protein [Lactiplantibacillus plantarum]WNW17395.1 ParA family protein [Lactiplantibacillus plantarum]WNW20294.1 ParA family protein [Lactiplantibacillus plantarum]